MALADGVREESGGAGRAAVDVLDEHVGGVAECREAPPSLVAIEVTHGAALAEVPEEERQRAIRRDDVARKRRDETVGIAGGRLHLDHVRAEIGQDPPRERAAQIGQVDDTEMREYLVQRASVSGIAT
jgi:hypothetical protein